MITNIKKRKSYRALKKFGPDDLKVSEMVAGKPLLLNYDQNPGQKCGIFCLRIDADEHEKESFGRYYPVFKRFSEAISIFFNAYSFRDAEDEILKCFNLNLDIQSHGYYHHTYSDYESNRYNVNKAKSFFKKLGINTRGFVAPMGKWNKNLMRALEKEGYQYSSDFSYDYLGLPSYPVLNGRKVNVLEIPIFPVAPELFILNGYSDTGRIVEYYKAAIDEMIECGIPAIIYAHTNPKCPEIPEILDSVCEYALEDRRLSPMSMSFFFDEWVSGSFDVKGLTGKEQKRKIPSQEFMGVRAKSGFKNSFKEFMKEIICFLPKKVAKQIFREILK